MIENITLAIQGIFGHKLRSFLTMLGIIIGIAAIITIVSTIKGTNEQIKQNLIGLGTDAVKISLYQGDSEYDMSYNSVPDSIPYIREDELDEIKQIDNVQNASLYNIRRYSDNVFYKNKVYSGTIYGIDKNYFDVYNSIIKYGRNFDENDYKKFNKVAIIDETASESLFNGENPVGKIIEINKEPFTIIGVVIAGSDFKPIINSFQDYMTYNQNNSTGGIYIPISSWAIAFQFDEVQNVVIKADSTDNMASAGRNVSEYLNSRIMSFDDNGENSVSYKNDDLLKQAKQLQDLGAATNNQLIMIASISLIVGGIGVMNIMLVSVTERTKEIGLKKALGARRKIILLQFLTEASVLTSIGGILGVIVGIAMSEVIAKVSGTPVAISPIASAIAVVFSMAIGIIFGLIPAIKASKLNPIDALRSE